MLNILAIDGLCNISRQDTWWLKYWRMMVLRQVDKECVIYLRLSEREGGRKGRREGERGREMGKVGGREEEEGRASPTGEGHSSQPS